MTDFYCKLICFTGGGEVKVLNQGDVRNALVNTYISKSAFNTYTKYITILT